MRNPIELLVFICRLREQWKIQLTRLWAFRFQQNATKPVSARRSASAVLASSCWTKLTGNQHASKSANVLVSAFAQPKCINTVLFLAYQCGPNEVLNPCGNACDRKCSHRGHRQPCSKICDLPACWCNPGFFRNDKNECVKEDECEEKAIDEFFFL
jgi:hypothetical protein